MPQYDVAFAPVSQLSEWLRRKELSSTELTKLYLERIERLDPQLHAVITLTPERALSHAAAADAEIVKGRWRGRLHGVPYGAKDLVAIHPRAHSGPWISGNETVHIPGVSPSSRA